MNIVSNENFLVKNLFFQMICASSYFGMLFSCDMRVCTDFVQLNVCQWCALVFYASVFCAASYE